MSKRLKELLSDNDTDSEKSFDKYSRMRSMSPFSDKYSRMRSMSPFSDKYSRMRSMSPFSDKYSQAENKKDKYEDYNTDKKVPTLKEIEEQGGFTTKKELRDINNVPNFEENEEDAKREILFKFELLKKSYPTSIIPEFTIHSDYNTMKKTYEATVKRLSLDSSVETYKTYLIGGFMLCEYILGNFLGFNMEGFTQQQLISMSSYEKLLIELGEKSYVPSGSKWPVEIRLVFLIIMNAGLFIVSKMIMKKTGANLMGMINGMNTSNSVPVQAKRKRKMRGPNIDLNDIPDIDSNSNS